MVRFGLRNQKFDLESEIGNKIDCIENDDADEEQKYGSLNQGGMILLHWLNLSMRSE